MTLFEECIEAIGEPLRVLSEEETIEIKKRLVTMFPFTSYGRLDWGKVVKKHKVNTIGDIIDQVEEFDTSVFIIWNDRDYPVLQTDLENVLLNLDDVLCVSFDTWVLSVKEEYVIEFYHEGEVTVGLIG